MKTDQTRTPRKTQRTRSTTSRSSALSGRSIPLILIVMAVLTGALIVFASEVLLGVVHY